MPESNGMKIHPNTLELEKYRAVQSLRPGKLIWGILGKYPYWPCMVCTDPSGLFLRQSQSAEFVCEVTKINNLLSF